MRFADKRYYVEKYVKCANCGMLVYAQDEYVPANAAVEASDQDLTYCSEWCASWNNLRGAEDSATRPRLPREGM